MGRLPLHIVLSLLAVDVVAFGVFVQCATSPDGDVGRWVVTAAAAVLAFGATAALCERTWGVGLMLATATAFFVAGVLGMGPHVFGVAGRGSTFFYAVAATGALPFLVTMKHMARFHLGATVLFAMLAGAAGTTASLVWNAAASP